MFLKVMHDGADEFLATCDSDATYSVFADVTSCDFKRHPDGSAYALVQCREPIKTAELPGYAEIQKHITLSGDAFLMNDQGRTVSKFTLRGSLGAKAVDGPSNQTEEEMAIKVLQNMPYAVGALIRKTARSATNSTARSLIDLLDKARVATDA